MDIIVERAAGIGLFSGEMWILVFSFGMQHFKRKSAKLAELEGNFRKDFFVDCLLTQEYSF
jgi:hypothetical protein